MRLRRIGLALAMSVAAGCQAGWLRTDQPGIVIQTGGDPSVTTRLAAVEASVADMPTRDLNVRGEMAAWGATSLSGWINASAVSMDGRVQAVVGCTVGTPQHGFISESADYGMSWRTAIGSNRSWVGIAMNSNGTRQVALDGNAFGGSMPYYSTDTGATWTACTSDAVEWRCCAMSMDGTHVLAGSDRQGLYLSTNGGVSFAAIAGLVAAEHRWTDVDISADGQCMLGACELFVRDEEPYDEYGGGIYVSTNFGRTWAVKQDLQDFQGVAVSSDGARQAACGQNGRIVESADYGASWTAKGAVLKWGGVAISGDGRRQIATCRNVNGYNVLPIYVSNDYGETWNLSGGLARWGSVCMSADGAYQLVTEIQAGTLWTSHAIARIRGNLTVECALGLGARGELAVVGGTQLVFRAGGVTNVLDSDVLHP